MFGARVTSPFDLYRPDCLWGLAADTYSFTMPQAWVKKGWESRRAVFYGFFRTLPPGCRSALFGGAELYADLVRRVVYNEAILQWMASLRTSSGHRYFSDEFLRHLEGRGLSIDLDTLPDGELAFPHEPIMRGSGPLWELCLIEGGLLNVVNTYSGGMSEAARLLEATGFEVIADNSLRRGRGIMGAVEGALAAYLGGIARTSNMMAAHAFGIPPSGTMAHCFVTSFDREEDAFLAFAEANQGNCVFLIDTYGSERGIRTAVRVALAMRERGLRLDGIRLDSGDLAGLSILARRLFDEVGLPEVAVTGSNSLSAAKIRQLRASGARISLWAVGDAVAAAPLFGAVWKASAVADEHGDLVPVLKVSDDPAKSSLPGTLDVGRCFTDTGEAAADLIYDTTLDAVDAPRMLQLSGRPTELAGVAERRAMLRPVVRGGQPVRPLTPHAEVRARAIENVRTFTRRACDGYPVGLAPSLAERRSKLIHARVGT